MPVGLDPTREYIDAKVANVVQRLNESMLVLDDACKYVSSMSDAQLKAMKSTSQPPNQYKQADVDLLRAVCAHANAITDLYNTQPGKSILDSVRGID